MAARHQGNNKAKSMKQKRPQKKGQPARKRQKRLQPKKQKKHQATKAGSWTVRSISSPRIFASKMLRLMPKVRMETKARELMMTLLMEMYGHTLKEMESLSRNNESATIDPAAMRAAFQEAMTRQLSKHSSSKPPTDAQAVFQEAVATELAQPSVEPSCSETPAA